MDMKQDSRITAYVAGELTDGEKEQFELELRNDEALRKEVNAVRRFVTEVLPEHDVDGPLPVKGPQAMLAEVQRRERIMRLKRRRIWLSAAALVILTLTVASVFLYHAISEKKVTVAALENDMNDVSAQPDSIIGCVPSPLAPLAPLAHHPPLQRNLLMKPLTYVDRKESEIRPRLFSKGVRDSLPLGSNMFQYMSPRLFSKDVRDGERYQSFQENEFLAVTENPLSTFSLDVDTASWANIRRYITQNHCLPPVDAVRLEEMLNYFRYHWQGPSGDEPFAVYPGLTECPWNPEHRLLRLAVKAREPQGERPPVNLVLLVDVSGSMEDANKLPLLKKSIQMLADNFRKQDTISMVTYADGVNVVLNGVSGAERRAIRRKLDELRASGCTNGEGGIQLAYQLALKHFKRGGVNRVILGTDGDFNVGISDIGELSRFIAEQAKTGVFLSIMGFGMGNYHDSTLKRLSSDGNGNYGYIDTLSEARKLLVEQVDSTLVTVAKDVKVQVEFNPAQVAGYRLLGYENRVMAKEEFNDDKKDAGDIGAGHCVTVLYEIVPVGKEVPASKVDALKYQKNVPIGGSAELATVKLRYKEPKEDTSKLLSIPPVSQQLFRPFTDADEDLRFAATVASFGLVLRKSSFQGNATFDSTLRLAEQAIPENADPERKEFLSIVRQAASLK